MLPAILALALATATGTPTGTPTATPTPTAAATPALAALGAPELPAASAPSAGLWVSALLLAGLAAGAFALTRRRTRQTRMVEVVESTSIGPRRSLVVARLGEELLLLGSSEAGIALLSTTPAPPRLAAAPAPPAEGRGFGLLARLRLAPQRAPAPAFDSLLSESLEDVELRRKLASGQAGSVR